MKKSDFNANVVKLFSSNFFAQLLPIAISPIITRIYSPESFGVFSIFLAFVGLGSVAASGRYDLAVVLPDTDDEAGHVLLVGVATLIFTCTVLTVGGAYFFDVLVDYSGMYFELFLLPGSIFILSAASCANYFLIRLGAFNVVNFAILSRSLIFCVFQLTLFYVLGGAGALILAWILGVVAYFFILYFTGPYIFRRASIKAITAVQFKKAMFKFCRFPMYSAPASILSTIAAQSNILLIPLIFSKSILGFYALVERLLAAPIAILGNAVGQVYLSRISNCTAVEIKSIFLEISRKMFVFSFVLFACFFFLAPYLVGLVFGDDWSGAAVFFKLYSIQFSIQLLVSPLIMTLHVFDRNRVEFIFQSMSVLIYFCVYGTAWIYELEFFTVALSTSLLISANYISLYTYMFRLVSLNSNAKKVDYVA